MSPNAFEGQNSAKNLQKIFVHDKIRNWEYKYGSYVFAEHIACRGVINHGFFPPTQSGVCGWEGGVWGLNKYNLSKKIEINFSTYEGMWPGLPAWPYRLFGSGLAAFWWRYVHKLHVHEHVAPQYSPRYGDENRWSIYMIHTWNSLWRRYFLGGTDFCTTNLGIG